MIEVLEKKLDIEGTVRVKVISDRAVSEDWMLRYVSTPAVALATFNCYGTAALNLFYGEVVYPVRGPVDVYSAEWKKFRRFVAWKIMPGERMGDAICEASMSYLQLFARFPTFAFVHKLPRQVENGIEHDGVMIFQAEWALHGCVMVGG